jgi:RNA recognition motif-containing protein
MTTEEQIRQVFAPFGSIEEFYMFNDKETHAFKGCAFVKYSGKDSCLKAIEALNGKFLMNGSEKPLEVRWAEVKSKKQAMPKMMDSKPATMSAYYPMYIPMQQNLQPAVQPPQFVEYFTAEGTPYYYNIATQKTQWEKPLNETSIMSAVQFQQLFSHTQASATPSSEAKSSNQGQKQGPKGANLFIFHVPNQWGNNLT